MEKMKIKNKHGLLGTVVGALLLAKLFLDSIKKKKKVNKDMKFHILGSTFEGLLIARCLIEEYNVDPKNIDLYVEELEFNNDHLYCPVGDFSAYRENTEQKSTDINILDGDTIRKYSRDAIDSDHMAMLYKLRAASRDSLENKSIEDWFEEQPDFFYSDFWETISALKFFKKHSSLIVFREEIKNFLYNENFFRESEENFNINYQEYRRELVKELMAKNVNLIYDTVIHDIRYNENHLPTSLLLEDENRKYVKALGDKDILFITNASRLDNIKPGSTDERPEIDMSNPISKDIWELMLEKEPDQGKPEEFLNHITDTAMYSFSMVMKEETYKKISKRLEGKLIIKHSYWDLTLDFLGKEGENYLIAGYGLEPIKRGNKVDKYMRDSNGREILEEICGHLNIILEDEDLKDLEIYPLRIPYATANRMVKNSEILPKIKPDKLENTYFVSTFVRKGVNLQSNLERAIELL